MDPRDIIRSKREGAPLSDEQVRAFMGGYVAEEISDPVATALLATIFERGMEPDELERWTRAMLESGASLSWDLDRPVVDKHSTGGVGDKVSLALAPALAACGAAVPMVSGRGLGHTGGTLDKLESIPGTRVDLSLEELRKIVRKAGCAIAAQSGELVPADRKLYALRDATGLVESEPLIASSILSKKLAEGLDALVLDVKFGSGAFIQDPERGAELARTMLALAARFGLPAVVLQTSMEEPLGEAVGHALEVVEVIQCLRGEGPADLRELVLAQGAELLCAAGLAGSQEQGHARIAESLDGGEARDALARMVACQGGDARAIEAPERLPRAATTTLLCSPASGVLDVVDCRAIGRAAAVLGGGRIAAGVGIDPAVGVRWLARSGREIEAGAPLAEIHHQGERGLAAAMGELRGAIAFDTGREPAPLVLRRIAL